MKGVKRMSLIDDGEAFDYVIENFHDDVIAWALEYASTITLRDEIRARGFEVVNVVDGKLQIYEPNKLKPYKLL